MDLSLETLDGLIVEATPKCDVCEKRHGWMFVSVELAEGLGIDPANPPCGVEVARA